MSTGATLLARTLRVNGVTTVFGLCGDHTNPLFEAIDAETIRIVDARDERGAAWMAAGWALATGEPGVVVVSNTPALANAFPALLDSQESGIPVVCLTGGVATRDRGHGHPGDRDQAAFASTWAKWAAPTPNAHDAGLAVARALAMSRRARPGVAVLEIPLDHQQARTDREPAMLPSEPVAPQHAAVEAARAALSASERPVIVAGEGCFWSAAADALRSLAERARIPVFTVRAARGLLPDDDEHCFGFPNLMTEPAQAIFGEADVAIVAGARLDLLLGGGAFHPGCTVVRVEAAAAGSATGRRADVEVTGDPGLVLASLASGAEPLPTDAWMKRLRTAEDARAAAVAERARIATSPLHPGRLVAEIAARLPRDAMVAVDAGALALWAIDAIPARAPASLNVSSASPAGSLGMGLPWAIGMKVARPDRPALALVGDGSFGFCALEVETAARHGVPVAVVVGNDGGWGIVRHLQLALRGRALASDLPRSPYELLAEFAGGVGDRVETPQQLAIAVTNALVAPVPSVVNAIIDPEVRHEALPLIAAMFEER